MQGGTDVGSGAGTGTAVEGTLDTEDDTIPSATSLVTPRTELFSGRWSRASGIHVPRTLVRSICTCHLQTFSFD